MQYDASHLLPQFTPLGPSDLLRAHQGAWWFLTGCSARSWAGIWRIHARGGRALSGDAKYHTTLLLLYSALLSSCCAIRQCSMQRNVRILPCWGFIPLSLSHTPRVPKPSPLCELPKNVSVVVGTRNTQPIGFGVLLFFAFWPYLQHDWQNLLSDLSPII